MTDQIHKEMTIQEIFDNYPHKSQKLAQVMTDAGLHCVGCQASTWETLEEGVLGHGMEASFLEELVARLNTVLSEKQDLSTITITPKAAQKFLQILKEEGETTAALRFGEKAGGCSGYQYFLDFSKGAEADDVILHSNGIDIHVQKDSLERLIGSEIDYVEALQGGGFKISNPNVRSSCGCGNSQGY